MNSPLRYYPVVYAVGDTYKIFALLDRHAVFKVTVGGEDYFDHSNGVLRSGKLVHSVTVPMAKLDAAREYTVTCREVTERKSYRSETLDPVSIVFSFKPLPVSGDIKIFHIADTHGYGAAAVDACLKSGAPDLLVLNGDIVDSSAKTEYFDVIFEIAGNIAKGEVPVIFSRGNHDLRGAAAEDLQDYIPLLNGATYFTFRLGRLWGIVLDCGEDKPDDNVEYGNIVACHPFRLEETRFIEKVIENAASEYEADGVEYRVVIAHFPISYRPSKPFDNEDELYTRWSAMLREHVKPLVMLCGHMHVTALSEIGGRFDSRGQPCPVVIGARQQKTENGVKFTGAEVILRDGGYINEFKSNI